MRKRILIFILFFITTLPGVAASYMAKDRFINKNLYKNIYPSTLNKNVKSIALKAQLEKTVSDNKIVEEKTEDRDTQDDTVVTEKPSSEKDLQKELEESKIDEKNKKLSIETPAVKNVQATLNKVQLEKNVTKKDSPAITVSVNQKKTMKLANRARLDTRTSDSDAQVDTKNSAAIQRSGTTVRSGTAVRSGASSARSATGANVQNRVVPRGGNAVRAGITPAAVSSARSANHSDTQTTTRQTNVVPRNRARSAVLGRNTTTNAHPASQDSVSSQQCFARYKECMDTYCERQDAAYDRCYCSAKLAQIDSKYQKKIDSLIQQIIRLKYNNSVSDEEINAYWDETVGVYTHTNPWVNIDNALNIDWSSTENRIRGQNAFTTGHSYCVGYLRSCSYMAQSLRDAYKSEIERDCATYEQGLSHIQMAAESVVENYK